MKWNEKIAFVLALGGFLTLLLTLVGAAVSWIVGSTITISEDFAQIWLWGFIMIPIILSILFINLRNLLFAVAIAPILGLGAYGAVNDISIYTKWYFWLVTIIGGCIAFFILSRCLAGERKANKAR